MGKAAQRRREKATRKAVAAERLTKLAQLAAEAAAADRLDRAKRYGQLAKRLAMRVQAPLPRGLRRALCHECGAYLVPGRSARVRARPGRIVVTCAECGAVKRLPHGRRAPPTR